MRHPYFDDGIVTWSDELRGRYEPADYSLEFEDEWRMFLEGREGWSGHPGAEITDEHVDARIRDLTGISGYLASRNGGRQSDPHMAMEVEPPFPPEWYAGKHCLDAGCGGGRWTRALMELGASVTSIDASSSSITSVQRFNPDSRCLSLFEVEREPSYIEAFDLVFCWGVLMHTHDPARAFQSVAKAVRPGGILYVMIYAPEGMHADPANLAHRKRYHRELRTREERLRFVYECAPDYSQALGWYDLLNPTYNWVVPEDVIHAWFRQTGFPSVLTLNATQVRCAHHVIGMKRPDPRIIRSMHA
jgi:SAM-dependent methyltransferase